MGQQSCTIPAGLQIVGSPNHLEASPMPVDPKMPLHASLPEQSARVDREPHVLLPPAPKSSLLPPVTSAAGLSTTTATAPDPSALPTVPAPLPTVGPPVTIPTRQSHTGDPTKEQKTRTWSDVVLPEDTAGSHNSVGSQRSKGGTTPTVPLGRAISRWTKQNIGCLVHARAPCPKHRSFSIKKCAHCLPKPHRTIGTMGSFAQRK